MTWLTLTTDGSLRTHNEPSSLSSLQATVGGLIEAVNLSFLPDEPTLFVNEEGKLNGLPINFIASLIADPVLRDGDLIVGDVAFTGGPDHEGETQGLTGEQVRVITGLVNLARAHLLQTMLRTINRATAEGIVVFVEDSDERP